MKKLLSLLGWFFCVVGAVFMLIMCLLPVVGVVSSVLDMEHYNRVWEDPIEVTGIITEHDSYDDDGDTDYRSRVEYTVDGEDYDCLYENEENAENLTPVGEQVTLWVSPEEPSKLLSGLKSGGITFAISLPFLCLVLYFVVRFLADKCVHKNMPDWEGVCRDVKVRICTRFGLWMWLPVALGYGFARLRYPLIIDDWAMIVAAICGGIWVWRLLVAIRDLGAVSRDEHTLRQSILVAKDSNTDSDGDTTYTLTYQSGEDRWNTNVTLAKYNRAAVGTKTWAVFLPGKKKPTVHYDE